MIEIVIQDVDMPSVHQRKYKKECKVFGGKNEEWHVIDTETNNIRYKGKFEDVCLAWHNLNKAYYRAVAEG